MSGDENSGGEKKSNCLSPLYSLLSLIFSLKHGGEKSRGKEDMREERRRIVRADGRNFFHLLTHERVDDREAMKKIRCIINSHIREGRGKRGERRERREISFTSCLRLHARACKRGRKSLDVPYVCKIGGETRRGRGSPPLPYSHMRAQVMKERERRGCGGAPLLLLLLTTYFFCS